MDGQGNLERTWKVMKFENKWLWQAVFRKFICSVQVHLMYFIMRWSKLISVLIGGLLLKERICSLQILSFKNNPKFEVIQFEPLNNIIKMNYYYVSEDIENCKMSGKNQGKAREFEVDDKWQPWYGNSSPTGMTLFSGKLSNPITNLDP